MTELEKIATQIGEFVVTEISEVKNVEYTKDENCELNAFTIVFKSGKRYAVNIKEVNITL